MLSNPLFLSNTIYVSEKRQIIIEFSGNQKKFSKRFSFFPFFYMPNNSNLVELIKNFDSKRLKIDVLNKKTVRVIAATFFDLKNAAQLIKKNLQKEVLLVFPTRQFLIEKNWSYFDSFLVVKDELIKTDKLIAPEVFLDFLSTTIKKSFFDLKKNSETSANIFLEKICLSNLLKTSVLDIPISDSIAYELFLENMVFKNKFPCLINSKRKFSVIKSNNLKQDLNGFAKLNFLTVLNSLSTFPFYNLGFDSINCSCCVPINAKLSPSSLVEVEFLVDGVYFESSFKKWASHFHLINPLKKRRVNFQKEWFLNSTPVGPFFISKKAIIPLVDFKSLVKKNLVKNSFNLKKSVWFCNKKESFLSIETKEYNKAAVKIAQTSNQIQSSKISSSGILFTTMLLSDYSYFYFKILAEQLKKLHNGCFLSLLDSNCCFFDQKIADSVSCIQNGVLMNFQNFAQENGSQSTKIKDFNAFIKAKNPLFLTKQFCATFRLPFPEISF